MCDVCRKTPCSPQCPNADEAKPIEVCDRCGENIYSGDTAYLVEDFIYCEECMSCCAVEFSLKYDNN